MAIIKKMLEATTNVIKSSALTNIVPLSLNRGSIVAHKPHFDDIPELSKSEGLLSS